MKSWTQEVEVAGTLVVKAQPQDGERVALRIRLANQKNRDETLVDLGEWVLGPGDALEFKGVALIGKIQVDEGGERVIPNAVID